ncbi:chloroplastic group IIA intron splicing facilitator CRS1, chloroplastic isoform X2 [Olea europaea var. sylvestris]|uniref:chloroplastic group IIA intron splicing facilitator CRS1, chloroplastic isoform X2 n=1 Tax=Olea europaea var. sylvestris TaxID=158386 RepID=UPI000C1CE21C|nr:chloroplastic group IIA intron splicing facilitator CRS1, chloroplastic isoform X2 [Olea europaea var. sylvestris]
MSATSLLSAASNPVFPYNSTKNSAQSLSFHQSKVSSAIFYSPFINDNNAKVEKISSSSSSIVYENEDYAAKGSRFPQSTSAIKAPTAPWMKGPLLVEPDRIMKPTKSRPRKDSTLDKIEEHPDKALAGKVSGGRGQKAMKKIFQGIEKLQETENLEETQKVPENVKFRFAPGDLWGNADFENVVEVEEDSEVGPKSFETTELDIPFGEVENEGILKKMPWERDEKMVIRRVKRDKQVTTAELVLDGVLLKRLRGQAAIMRKWVKVKKAGVTQAVVDQIHLVWKNNELALIKFDLPLCRNMERAREITEVKTGGLVVWNKEDFLAVYRGCNYVPYSRNYSNISHKSVSDQENLSSNMSYQNTCHFSLITSSGSSQYKINDGIEGDWENLHINISLYEREADRLLYGLGPRFVDWWMPKPLPVDADLLPEVAPGFKPSFRLCPPRTRSKLTDAELTYLRKLTHPLPTHFVLGRNRKLQGLAAAILKLWEKCHIVKIALKWGIPNTDNEEMAYELKNLTGGVLLLRNKFFIILYRGKDFVPSQVATLVAEREKELTRYQLQEEAARLKASDISSVAHEDILKSSSIGTLSEFHSILSECRNLKNGKTEVEVQLEAERWRLEKELKNQERKLFILKKKKEKSDKTLAALSQAWRPSEQDLDQELITQEERECMREIGLKLDSSLVLGRRGVFDGVIEGIRQHWKHREIVKVITMQKKFSQVLYTAKLLEAESCGILVSVEKIKEGHAIIMYRGKNYKRPKLLPRNLLNRRDALSRSLEIQRNGSLKFFANQREKEICDLKRKLANLNRISD